MPVAYRLLPRLWEERQKGVGKGSRERMTGAVRGSLCSFAEPVLYIQ